MWLKISNPSIAPIEGFTILGLSTARGTENKIGQFGSGVKHSVILLKRLNIDFRIFLGKEELSFSTTTKSVNGTEYNELNYTFRGVTQSLSYCLEMGELDWDNVNMALREFISNAIDASNGEKTYEVVCHNGEATPIEGRTTIYIEWNSYIDSYMKRLDFHFLHFRNQEKLKFIPNLIGHDKPVIYRKGVMVREVHNSYGYHPMFFYNFTDEVKIDESRNMNDGEANSAISKMIFSNRAVLSAIFTKFKSTTEFYESTCIQSYHFRLARINNIDIPELWERIHGKAVIFTDPAFNSFALAKNIPVIQVSPQWYDCLRYFGVQTTIDVMTITDKKKVRLVQLRRDTYEAVQGMHKLCEKFNMSAGKSLPKVANFEINMDAGHMTLGFYDPDTESIYINAEYPTNKATILEELAHYYTGAFDGSRDIQDFGFRFAAKMME